MTKHVSELQTGEIVRTLNPEILNNFSHTYQLGLYSSPSDPRCQPSLRQLLFFFKSLLLFRRTPVQVAILAPLLRTKLLRQVEIFIVYPTHQY